MKKILSLLALSILFSISTFATHLSGGNIQYQCIGGDSMEITLTIVRNCSGIQTPTTSILTASSNCAINQNITLLYDTSINSSLFCPSVNTTCNGGTLPGFEIVTYKGIYVISDSCEHTITYNVCCRNSSNNITNSMTLPLIMETKIKKQTPCNSSPVIANNDPVLVCSNSSDSINYNIGAYDPDGNTLTFELSCGPNNFVFSPGNSCSSPFPGISIDSLTGQIKFVGSSMGGIGQYVAGIIIKEYDSNNNVIGQIYHEITILATACSSSNNAPVLSGINNVTGGTVSENVFSACPGSNLCFDLQFMDTDSLDTLSVHTDIQTALPGATVTITGVNPLNVNVCWNIPTNFNQQHFNVTVKDDFCMGGGAQTKSYYSFLINATGNYVNLPDSATICLGDSFYYSFCSNSQVTWADLQGSTANSGTYLNGCSTCHGVWASPSSSTTYVLTLFDGTTYTKDSIYIDVQGANGPIGLPSSYSVCQYDSGTISTNNNQVVSWHSIDLNTGLDNSYVLSCTNCSSVSFPGIPGNAGMVIYATSGTGNCASVDSTTINVKALSSNLNVPDSITICEGSQYYLNANTAANVQWSSASGNNMTVGTHISCDTCSSIWLAPDTDEIYTITDGHDSSCYTSAMVVVTIQELNDSLNLPDTIVACHLDTIQLSVFNTGQLTWSYQNINTSNGVNISCDSCPSIWAFPHQSDYLRVVDYHGNSCYSIDSVYIDKQQISTSPIIQDDTTICAGDTIILYSLALGNITWSLSTADSNSLQCFDCNNPWAAPTTTTTYWLYDYQSESCNATDSVTVTVNSGSKISGTINTSANNPLTQSKVYIVQNISGQPVIIDSVNTDSNGFYQWTTNQAMNVYIMASPNAQVHPTEQQTYYPNTTNFSNATPFNTANCINIAAQFNTISNSTSIAPIDISSIEANLFPNPGNSEFNIESSEIGQYILLDLKGQLIQRGKVSQGITKLNLEQLNNGMYILQINYRNGAKHLPLIKE